MEFFLRLLCCNRARALCLVLPALCLTLPVVAPALAQDAMVFDVLRDGDKIGEHRLEFEQLDGTLKVSVQTDMSVSFAFLTFFFAVVVGHAGQ